jgi:hypothetical protein
MKSVDDIFEAFGGPASLGRAIGKPTEHAGAMKSRRSIPVQYWPALVAAARDRGIREITVETLVVVHAEPERRAG